MFRLRKYYLDLVTRDGTALIAYAARLQFAGLRVGYSSVLLAPADQPPSERSVLDRHPLPRATNGTLIWNSPALELSGRWEGPAQEIRRTLLQTSAGSIRWNCSLARSSATVQVGETIYSGIGYAEWVRLTIAPWDLPFRTLRWGRHASSEHAVVWIAWSDREEASWIWLDGKEQPEANLGSDAITGLEGGLTLQLGHQRDIRDRRLLSGLGQTIPRLLPLVGDRLSTFREHKQLAPSALMSHGTQLDRGWTIHEVVTW